MTESSLFVLTERGIVYSTVSYGGTHNPPPPKKKPKPPSELDNKLASYKLCFITLPQLFAFQFHQICMCSVVQPEVLLKSTTNNNMNK